MMRNSNFLLALAITFCLGIVLQKVVGLKLDHLLLPQPGDVVMDIDVDVLLKVVVMCVFSVFLIYITRR